MIRRSWMTGVSIETLEFWASSLREARQRIRSLLAGAMSPAEHAASRRRSRRTLRLSIAPKAAGRSQIRPSCKSLSTSERGRFKAVARRAALEKRREGR
ncbi:MAG: hypothetical protein EOQ86_07410 [Mesorhizobium sp.]|nr:MAG: hypothetical protein EOQ85_08370 [Mesorhizobium sp.]RWH85968.1 MAG: hypothetical protein EOQ86_07410 [Mesorhizobium sp.]RWH91225.1 MAG: hypothetical protein EOQ87_11065 [Mesorhizobium sp.]RWH99907.1 MAG: hypothetical protein EOQ88_11175 [Mesorhizobium sp.]RWI03850.1 MAG: hypothetical protein EOQ89_09740 [Mesorhizobium sp.]